MERIEPAAMELNAEHWQITKSVEDLMIDYSPSSSPLDVACDLRWMLMVLSRGLFAVEAFSPTDRNLETPVGSG